MDINQKPNVGGEMAYQYYSNYEIEECFCTEHDHERNKMALKDLVDAIYNVEKDEDFNIEYIDDQIRTLASDYGVSVPEKIPLMFSSHSIKKIIETSSNIAIEGFSIYSGNKEATCFTN